MELRLLIGAHFTGQEHLRSQLEANRPLLDAAGTLLPDRGLAGQALSGALKAIRKNKATPETGPRMLSQLTGDRACDRVLMIDPDISGSMLRPHKNGVFYPRANSTVFQLIRQLGEEVPVRIYFATRNPATLLPACWAASLKHRPKVAFDEFNNASDPMDLRWSEYLHRVQGKDAEVPVTVWDWESYPRIWREVAQAFSGVPGKEEFVDCGIGQEAELSLRGADLMHAYLQQHPVSDPEIFEKVRDKFHERFPMGDDASLAGVWPADLVQGLTEAYGDDLYYIDRMDNLTTIRPETYA